MSDERDFPDEDLVILQESSDSSLKGLSWVQVKDVVPSFVCIEGVFYTQDEDGKWHVVRE